MDSILLDNEKKVLDFLSRNKDKAFTSNEISNALDKNKSSVSCWCTSLRKLGKIKVVEITEDRLTRKYQVIDGKDPAICIYKGRINGYIQVEEFAKEVRVSVSDFRRWVRGSLIDYKCCSIRGSLVKCYNYKALLDLLSVYKEEIKTEEEDSKIAAVLAFFEEDKERIFSATDIKNELNISLYIIRRKIKILLEKKLIKIVAYVNSNFYFQHKDGLLPDCVLKEVTDFISIKDLFIELRIGNSLYSKFYDYLRGLNRLRLLEYKGMYITGNSRETLEKELNSFLQKRKEEKEDSAYTKIIKFLRQNLQTSFSASELAEEFTLNTKTVRGILLDLLKKKQIKCVAISEARAREFQLNESLLQEIEILNNIPKHMASLELFSQSKNTKIMWIDTKQFNFKDKINKLSYKWVFKGSNCFKIYKIKDLENIYKEYENYKVEKTKRVELKKVKQGTYKDSKIKRVLNIFINNPDSLFSAKDLKNILNEECSGTLSRLARLNAIRVVGKERALKVYQLANTDTKISYTPEKEKLILSCLREYKYKGLTKKEINNLLKKRIFNLQTSETLLKEKKIKIVGVRKQLNASLYSYEYQISSGYLPEIEKLSKPPKGYKALYSYLNKLKCSTNRTSFPKWFKEHEEFYLTKKLCEVKGQITECYPSEILDEAIEAWHNRKLVAYEKRNRDKQARLGDCVIEQDVVDEFFF